MSQLEPNDEDDLQKIIDETFKGMDKTFLLKLSVFSQSLLEFVVKTRIYLPEENLYAFQENIDLYELITQCEDSLITNVKVVSTGRFVLLTASCVKDHIKEILTNDFPKYLGYRLNFWRYLLDITSNYLRKVNADFTTQFLVANACYLEVLAHCFELNQSQITKHGSRIWMGVILHFFGERFKGEEKIAVLEMNKKVIEEIELALYGPRRPASQRKSKLVIPKKKQ